MNIAILGGAGYIGSALIEEFGHTLNYRIMVIDREFRPQLVATLPANAKYIQADIGDMDAMRVILKEADLVYMLAAEVEAETSKEKEVLFWRENYEKPTSLLPLLKGKRLVIASTANLFGGGLMSFDREGNPHLYSETNQIAPRFPYAQTKAALEQAVRENHDGGYTLLRFGTNYGWSPGVRFNLVVNLFVKRILQGWPMLLFKGGNNWRAFCCVRDCARAAAFIAKEGGRAEDETFHVVSENFPIFKVAEIVAQVAGTFPGLPPIEIQDVDREADFSSYALSSDKIKSLGFQFEWNMTRGVQQMIGHLCALRPAGEW